MIFAFDYTVVFFADVFVGTIIISVMITKINTDVISGLNKLPHKLSSVYSIKLNAQMIMRSPIFVFLFTACPLFNNTVLKLLYQ